MLRLEKLELIGFKSFFSRTEFQFNEDITAIVGPNGCGKSNIGDALNWVIGEQSVKSLRGDHMEDVIFNGSESRRPLGMAEVSLHLRNGTTEGGEEKLVVTRRLFRSGESEYLINGERTRLRDVQEALTRINVGSGVYSIIEQGKVDAALSSRPRERRVLIEEAAGIALYKTRKRQAETKLEATEANLARVNDIVSELDRQIGSLKRQAARARRFARTTEEIRRHERILLFHEHGRLDRERRQVGQREDAARGVEAEAAAALAGQEAGLEEGRRRLEQQESRWRQGRDAMHALEREMDRQQHEIAASRQQAAEAGEGILASRRQSEALQARLEEVTRQIEARRAERDEHGRRLAALGGERETQEGARRHLDARVDALEADLSGLRASLLQVMDALGEARNRKRQVEEDRARLSRQTISLDREERAAVEEAARAGAARQSAGQERLGAEAVLADLETALDRKRAEAARLQEALARETLRRQEARQRLHGHEERLRAIREVEATSTRTRDLLEGIAPVEAILADGFSVPAHLESAVEIYLGAFLDAALVPGIESAASAIASLKSSGRGRAAFLPAADPESPPVVALPEEVRGDSGFLGRLSDLVETDPARSRALSVALSRALVTDSLSSALRLRRLAPYFDYLSLEGDILHTSGLIEGGARRPEGAGLLTRRRLQLDLQTAIDSGRTHLEGLGHLVSGLEADHAAAAREAAALAESRTARDRELVELRLREQSAAEEEARVRARVAAVLGEKAMRTEELAALETEQARLGAMATELDLARRRHEESIAAAQEEIARLRAVSSEAGEKLAQLRATISAAGERLESVESELARGLEADQELRDRIQTESARQADLTRRLEEASLRQQAAAAALQDHASRRALLEAQVQEGESLLISLRAEAEQRVQEVRSARAALEQARSLREAITLEKERVDSDLRHLVAGALAPAPAGSIAPSGEAASLDDLFALITPQERDQDPVELAAALSELRQRRDRLGPVNMLALDEFRELEERHAFLSTQRKDLSDAIASLKETIARINRTSRERFLEAFERIRSEFHELFVSLFGGGRADLKLMTGEGEEDVLECGLEITAQPPGKRLQSVTLMSGGEKALTAVALLFAIFRYRPSPFCLLDEVDAPLDEANVIRFTQMLRTMSAGTQFVVITHNRTSMESARVLYGITMEEPGVSRTMSVVLDGQPDRAELVRTLPSMLAARHRPGPRRPAPPSRAVGAARPAGEAVLPAETPST